MEHPTKSGSILADEEIVELYWRRDQQAIGETQRKYQGFLLSIAYNGLGDRSDSEECINDTYLDAWNGIPPARPAHLKAFLATIVRRRAVDLYKAKNRQKRLSSELTVSLSELEEIIPSKDDPFALQEYGELARILNEFVRGLSDRRMYVFMSRYYAARSVKDVAKLLRCSESTVHKEIASIKRGLKEKLEKEGYFYDRK